MAADEDKTTGGGDNPAEGERRQRERRQRPPVTIDLKAESVPETSAKSEASRRDEPPVPPRREASAERRDGDKPARGATVNPSVNPSQPTGFPFAKMDDPTVRLGVAAVGGGIAALVIFVILQAIGLVPAPGRSAAYEAADAANSAAAATSALERRITAIETMVEGLPAMRSDLGALRTQVGSLESADAGFAPKSDVEGVVAALGTLREKVDALPVPATRADLDALTERIGRLEVSAAAGGGSSAASEAAIASLSAQLSEAETGLRALTERLAAAEAKVASLGTTPAPMAGGEAAVRAIAITALRRASEGDAPFLAEVDMASSLGIAGGEVNDLRPLAATGVPTEASIAAQFPETANAILSASAAADPDAGFFDRVVSGLGGLVTIRPAGPIAGDDPPAVVSRMTAAVEGGDLATALRERDALPEAGKAASAAWADQAASRVKVDTLVDAIARSVGAPAATSG